LPQQECNMQWITNRAELWFNMLRPPGYVGFVDVTVQ